MTQSIDEDDFEGEIDDSIEHPSPDELGLLCFDDPDFLEQLERRSADNSPGIPWSQIRDESL
ncbi:MAG: hypothetical protein AB7G28_05665 [Pirellulales bacterium]